jgi:guanosine-3',5'-bis(diphosphate) 3'-pyrophosphohydrolase
MSVTHWLTEAAEAFDRIVSVDPDIARAFAYADAAHSALDQRRKYTDRPYIEHPRMVGGLMLLTTTPQHAAVPVSAALLHDVIEDTDITADDLLRHFSGEIVDLVEQVTEPDDPDYWVRLGFDQRPNRATRRAIEADRRAEISAVGQSISVADLIANSHDIVEVADRDFAILYQSELRDRFARLTRADPKLRAIAAQLLADNQQALERETIQ